MRLADFVSRVPTVRLATAADNGRILDFFERAPMRTSGFAVQYRRRPDFFRLPRYQSDRAFVIVSDDGNGGVRGVGTISLRPGWIDGRPTTVGYLGDLRVKPDRAISARWRPLFGELIARAGEIEELADCTHWFTTILDDNRLARQAFASSRPGLPRLVRIAPFTMRNLLLRLPRLLRRHPRWHVAAAGLGDRAMLGAFFEGENRRLPFGFRGELERRLGCWPGLSISDFVYAADDRGIVACVAPWSSASAKQTVVSRLPPVLRALGRASAWLPSRPIRMPKPGEPLRTPYLTHLVFAERLDGAARRTVFRAMLDHLFDRWQHPEQQTEKPDWHCVALCDFAAWGLGAALRGFVQQTVPISIYSVLSPASGPLGAGALPAAPPAFEMAMV
jgi:hypothetical protein